MKYEEAHLRSLMSRLLAVTITETSSNDTTSSEDDDPIHIPTNQRETRPQFDGG